MIALAIAAQVCHAVFTNKCTPCSQIKGTYSYQTELKQFCRCKDKMQEIYHIDNDTTKQLACQTLEKGKIVIDYFLAPSPCKEGEYYDHQHDKCVLCKGPADMRTENGLCVIPDGWEVTGVTARCAMGFEAYSVEGKFAGCRQCQNGTYSVFPSEASQSHYCGTCGELQFRQKVFCMDFSTGCAKMAWNEEMQPGHHKNGSLDLTCRCKNGELPLYSMKTGLHSCISCKEDSIPTRYNGNGIPSYVCRQKDRTILNTTCPEKFPLDNSTGLCSCPSGFATTVIYDELNQTTHQSTCVPVIQNSAHVTSCDKNSLFYFEYKGYGQVLCGTRHMVVDDDDDDDDDDNVKNSLAAGAVAGIAVGVGLITAVASGLIVYLCMRRKTGGDRGTPNKKLIDAPEQLMI